MSRLYDQLVTETRLGFDYVRRVLSTETPWIQESNGAPAAPPTSEPQKSRPQNWARSLFHFGAALLALIFVIILPSRAWMLGFCGAFFIYAWTMELARYLSPKFNERIMRFYNRIAHTHEHKEINSATWYVTALMLLALFASKPAMASAVMVLGVADPAAGFIGRRYGKRKLFAGRSLEGSMAFVLVGFGISLPFLLAFGSWTLTATLGIAALCGLVGAITELFSRRLDDNLTIPAVIGGMVTVVGLLA